MASLNSIILLICLDKIQDKLVKSNILVPMSNGLKLNQKIVNYQISKILLLFSTKSILY